MALTEEEGTNSTCPSSVRPTSQSNRTLTSGMIGIVMIVIGVFVSNERDREMRGSSAQGAELDSSVCNSSFRESRTSSLGQFNSSRSLKDLPSQERIFKYVGIVFVFHYVRVLENRKILKVLSAGRPLLV